MVPGSTLIYGSNFCIVTVRPRSTSSRPNDAAAMPFPNEDTTPPVTKMYLVEFGLEVIRPALDKRASELPLVEDLRLCRHRAALAHPGVPLRWSVHSEAPATAPTAQPFLRDLA